VLASSDSRTTLLPGREYQFQVEAVATCGRGEPSKFSNVVRLANSSHKSVINQLFWMVIGGVLAIACFLGGLLGWVVRASSRKASESKNRQNAKFLESLKQSMPDGDGDEGRQRQTFTEGSTPLLYTPNGRRTPSGRRTPNGSIPGTPRGSKVVTESVQDRSEAEMLLVDCGLMLNELRYYCQLISVKFRDHDFLNRASHSYNFRVIIHRHDYRIRCCIRGKYHSIPVRQIEMLNGLYVWPTKWMKAVLR